MTASLHLLNETRGTCLGEKIDLADNFVSRFNGLMWRKSLPEGSGLWISPCNSVHMFWMFMPLDILFLDRDQHIVHTIENLRPWRVSPLIKKAHSVLELPVGSIQKTQSQVGDLISSRQN